LIRIKFNFTRWINSVDARGICLQACGWLLKEQQYLPNFLSILNFFKFYIYIICRYCMFDYFIFHTILFFVLLIYIHKISGQFDFHTEFELYLYLSTLFVFPIFFKYFLFRNPKLTIILELHCFMFCLYYNDIFQWF